VIDAVFHKAISEIENKKADISHRSREKKNVTKNDV